MDFTTVGTLSGARFGVPMAQASLLVEAGGTTLRLFNPVAAETVRISLSATGLATVAGSANHGTARTAATVGGVAGSLATDLIVSAKLAPGVALTGYLTAVPTAAQAVEVMAFSAQGIDYLIAARSAGSGADLFRIGADNSLTRVATVEDTAERCLGGLSSFALGQAGGMPVIFAGSGSESGITTLGFDANGGLTVLDQQGTTTGVPFQGVTCLRTIEAAGQSWLIAGSAGSPSLTVFRIGADGKPVLADHVIDGLATRLAGVTALDAVTVAGRVFVAVAGADDGISLFTLLPDGTLLHVATMADGTSTSLANISDLRLSVVGGVLQVLALSAAEAGLTQLSVDLGGLGTVGSAGSAGDDLLFLAGGGGSLSGGTGEDVLVDGAGSDSLGGGAGADVFVLQADGLRDLITDFDIRQDRIDLSRWGFFRNSGQLTITPTATGAILRFGTEEVELRSADGRPLSDAALRALDYSAVTRLPLAILRVDPPPPPPPPSPPALTGTAGNDTLRGTAEGEVLTGLGGNDLLLAGKGADTVDGGAGFDWLDYGGADAGITLDLRRWTDSSPDVAEDQVTGIEGFIGTEFADRMTGGAGAVWFRGGGGGDTLVSGTGGGLLDGGDGNDSLSGATGSETILGGAGHDSAQGGDGADTVDGGAGNDRMAGGAGNDSLTGGDGDDWIEGGAGADVLGDGSGDDTLYGGTENDVLRASAGMDWLYGDDGDDNLDGGIGNDRLFGGLGADRLGGGEGDDWLDGGDGVDSFADGAGNDTILAGAGNESIVATAGDDWLYGGEGNDTLDGGIGNDRLFGGTGGDSLAGGDGDDWLEGGDGADRLLDGLGNDTLYGGAGDESIGATAGNDWLYGDEGNDTLDGGEGQDRLYGGAGADLLSGGTGNDLLDGGAGNDALGGGIGNDSLYGGENDDTLGGFSENDLLDGGSGNDLLNAGAGDDLCLGGTGNDTLNGSTGNDTLNGGDGDDLLAGMFGSDAFSGGAGRDTLDAGRGNDRLAGGAGADVFLFSSFLRGEVDVITDYEDGIDRLRFLGLAGASDAARFRGLAIRDVTIDGVGYAEINRGGHLVLLEGVDSADLTVADFLFR